MGRSGEGREKVWSGKERREKGEGVEWEGAVREGRRCGVGRSGEEREVWSGKKRRGKGRRVELEGAVRERM